MKLYWHNRKDNEQYKAIRWIVSIGSGHIFHLRQKTVVCHSNNTHWKAICESVSPPTTSSPQGLVYKNVQLQPLNSERTVMRERIYFHRQSQPKGVSNVLRAQGKDE